MRAWVTGATGLLGSTLIEQLLRRGDQVTALVRPASRPLAAAWGAEVRIVEASLPFATNPFASAPAPEVVFHCAGMIRPEGPRQEVLLNELHIEGTAQMAELARRHGARLVHVSSLSAIGFRHYSSAIDESTACVPTDAYGATKLAAEQRLAEQTERGLDWVALRPPGIYGPRSRGDLVLSMARSIARGRYVLVGDGRAPISCVYAGNLAAAMIHFAAAELPRDRVVLIDDGRPCSRLELASKLARLLGRRQRFPSVPRRPALWAATAIASACRKLGIEPPVRPADVRRRSMSFEFCTDRMRALGFSPPHDLDHALGTTVAWHRSRGAL